MKEKTAECEYCLLPLSPSEVATCSQCGVILCWDCICKQCENAR